MKVLPFEEFSLMKNKFTLGAFIAADSPHLFTKHKGLYFLHPLYAAAAPVLVLGNNIYTFKERHTYWSMLL